VAQLRHRNLVHVIDIGEVASGQRMMVLELVRGVSLASLIAAGPLGRDRVIDIVRQLLHGLAHAHAAGLVHRDLKPENVLVERDVDGAEVPRIVDFGIAVPCDPVAAGATQRITEIGMVLGTPAYMAPEQAKGEAPDPRTDLFALGVMAYEMLAGVLPFSGGGVEVILSNVSKDPPPIHRRAPGVAVDPLLEAFARRLMARSLAERFSSAEAALEALALIERDRAAAAGAFGLVTEMDLVDTAPSHVPAAMRARPRPTAGPDAETQLTGVVQVPAAVPEPAAAPAPTTAPIWRPRSALLGCAVFATAAALAFALVGA